MKRISGPWMFALTLLAVLGARPALAGEALNPALPATAVAPASVQSGCAPVLDLAAALSAKEQVCPSHAPDSATPQLMARPSIRTCGCSCGFPCTSDADCGPDGVCAPGITCC
jgi:hypothetical protein